MELLEIILAGIVFPIALIYFIIRWGESQKNNEVKKKSEELKNVEQSLKNEAIEKALQEGRLDDVAALTSADDDNTGEKVTSSNRTEKEFEILKQELKNKALETALLEERDEDIPALAKKDYAEKNEIKEKDSDQIQSETSVDIFFKAVKDFDQVDSIEDSVQLIKRMEKELDEKKASKISRFFDRYLPVITEVIQASKTEEADPANALSIFNEITQKFYNELYQGDAVVESNTKLMEQLAMRDGLYDYEEQ